MHPDLRLIVLGSVLALALGGCDPYHCGAWATEVDGVCVGEAPPDPPEDPPTVEEWIATMGDCTLLEPAEPVLDLQEGCVGGACLGDTLEAFIDKLGQEPVCEPYGDEDWVCDFRSGVRLKALPPAEGGEGPDLAAAIVSITLSEAFTGTTGDGVGMGVSPVCFVDALGMPDLAYFSPRVSGRWDLAMGTWDELGVEIRDGAQPLLGSSADGSTDHLVLFDRLPQ